MVQSKPGQIIPRDPIFKIPNTKTASGVAQGVDPEFKPQYHKKEKSQSKLAGA
jgi:hypothetical protein